MKPLKLCLMVSSMIAVVYSLEYEKESNETLLTENDDSSSKVLSRRKRYLTFPDGSSFQLVFCAQNQGYYGLSNILWFGNTAALAWELPTDSRLFTKLKEPYSAQKRNDITRNIYYMNEKGKVIAKVPYKKRVIINPAFAKRSIEDTIEKENEQINNTSQENLNITGMHEKQKGREYLKTELSNAELDRDGRKGLYEKIENLVGALGWNGRQCVLRLLCEGGKDRSQQGTFLQEIFGVVFTLPKGREILEEHHKEYDAAHQAIGDCEKMYPQCENKSTGEALFRIH